jgi:hypothetical protein
MLTSDQDFEGAVRVLNSAGAIERSVFLTLKANTPERIDLSRCSSGALWLGVENGDELRAIKLVRQR